MIKAIFFDFDGVLTNFECGSSTVCYNLSKKTGISEEKLLECYDDAEGLVENQLLLGKALHKDVWGGFCRCIGKKIDMGLLDYAFRNTPMNERMLDLAEKLRKKYKIGIITDNTKERFSAIIDEFGLRDKFDAIILSADVGATKKEERIFRVALNALKLKPQECVFIDNNARNLRIPAQMGFKTIYYNFEKKDFDGLIKALSAIGVKV